MNGEYRYGRHSFVLYWFPLLGGIVLASSLAGEGRPGLRSAAVILAMIFMWILLFFRATVRLYITPEFIAVKNRFREKRIRLDEITALEFSKIFPGRMKICSRQGALYVSMAMDGTGEFLRKLKAELDQRGRPDCCGGKRFPAFLNRALISDRRWEKIRGIFQKGKIIFWSLYSVLAAGMVVILTVMIAARIDGRPADAADLRLAVRELPEEQNAYYHFRRAAEDLYWPTDKVAYIADLLQGKTWDEEFVAELIGRNGETIAAWEQGLQCGQMQAAPEPLIWERAPELYLNSWPEMARLNALRARARFKAGDREEGFAEAIKIIRFGHMIEGGKGDLLNYICGYGIKKTGLRTLIRIIPDTPLEKEATKTWMAEISRYRINGEYLADTYRHEYAQMTATIDNLPGYLRRMSVSSHSRTWNPVTIRAHLLPNRTKRLCAERIRKFIAAIPESRLEMDRSGVSENIDNFSKKDLFLTGNFVGKMMCWGMVKGWDQGLICKCEENVTLSALQLLLALKSYSRDNEGRLPASLQELVPEYIAGVPRDDFDGREMKYSPEKRIVYSVGRDLKDSGGIRNAEPADPQDDLSFKIEF